MSLIAGVRPGEQGVIAIKALNLIFICGLFCVGQQNLSPQPEDPIVDEIANAYSNGNRTFVIGSPGSEVNVATGTDARPWLSYAAEQGGIPPGRGNIVRR